MTPLGLLTLLSAAHAATTLLLVGDTGKEGHTIAPVVSAAVKAELERSPDATLVALGDLYYPNPPRGRGCADAVEERYRAWYGDLPAGRTVAVAGNHDLTHSHLGFSKHAAACTEEAFRRVGWLAAGEGLGSRTVALSPEVALVLMEHGFYGKPAPSVPAVEGSPTWVVGASHYPREVSTDKCKENARVQGWPWPEMDLQVAGHAHHLEARLHAGTLVVTSGAGSELRAEEPKGCTGIAPGLYREVSPNGTRADAGGYTRLVFDGATVQVTPFLCTVAEGCAARPGVICERSGPRGVTCR